MWKLIYYLMQWVDYKLTWQVLSVFISVFNSFQIPLILRFSAALEIQWPLLDFCCKMNSTSRQLAVIILLLYCLVDISWSVIKCHWLLLIMFTCRQTGIYDMPSTSCMHIFHNCMHCWKWWTSGCFSDFEFIGWSSLLLVRVFALSLLKLLVKK